MKRRFFLVILTVFMLIGSQFFHIAECKGNEIHIPEPRSGVYVYDEGAIFDTSIATQLNTILTNLEKATGVEFAVISVKDLSGKTIEEYSITVANKLGIGKKDKNNGILLLISKPDKRVRLEIGRGLEGILNDSKCGRILREFFVPHRENGDYDKAALLTTQAVVNVISADAKTSVDGVDTSIAPKEGMSTLENILVLILILIIILILIGLLSGFGGGYGGGYGGGFGGGSGGDCGGFGGGGFGGGGASA